MVTRVSGEKNGDKRYGDTLKNTQTQIAAETSILCTADC